MRVDAGGAVSGDAGGGTARQDARVSDAGPAARLDAFVAPAPAWLAPACATTDGSDGTVTFTRDLGATFAPPVPTIPPATYASDVLLWKPPGTLLAHHAGTVYVSTDSGCRWRALRGTVAGYGVTLRRASDDRAYAFSVHEGMWRIDGDTVSEITMPPDERTILDLLASAEDPDLLVALGEGCVVWRSPDGGRTWSRMASGPPGDEFEFAHAASIDPTNPSRMACGFGGVWFSSNGGAGWERSDMSPAERTFTLARSIIDHDVVWALALNDAGESVSRALHVSRDGGAHFTKIYTSRPELHLTNGARLVPDTTNADVVYVAAVVISLSVSGLGRVDASTGAFQNVPTPAPLSVGGIAPLPGTGVLVVALQNTNRPPEF